MSEVVFNIADLAAVNSGEKACYERVMIKEHRIEYSHKDHQNDHELDNGHDDEHERHTH